MRYNCIRIEPDGDDWRVTNHIDPTDRANIVTQPNANGYFYYPETMPFHQAKELLLDCMTAAHLKQINELTISRSKLYEHYYK
jgi:hypothetical protein